MRKLSAGHVEEDLATHHHHKSFGIAVAPLPYGCSHIERRVERQRQARGAGWRRDHEGMLRLRAKFDPEIGAQIEAPLEALQRQ